MAKRIRARTTPEALKWARVTAGYSIEDIACWAKKTPEEVRGWESGDNPLFMGQFRNLANRYKRPLSDFYLPEPPKERPLPRDFRRLPGEVAGTYSPALRLQLRLARERQEVAEYLAEDIGEQAHAFEGSARIDENPEAVGERVREMLKVTEDEQATWHGHYQALKEWRARIERARVLVFKFEKVHTGEALGFSVMARKFPVIGINVSQKPNGQIFTLLHEFAHLLLGESSICDIDDYTARDSRELRAEVFCNHVAAATLMPSAPFLAHELVAARGGARDWSDNDIAAIARKFSVSREATVRRLLTFDKTTKEFYQRKRSEYQEQYQQDRERERQANKGKPFMRGQVNRTVSNLGKQYVSIVLQSYGGRRITLADAANYLQVRASNVSKVQKLAFGGATLD